MSKDDKDKDEIRLTVATPGITAAGGTTTQDASDPDGKGRTSASDKEGKDTSNEKNGKKGGIRSTFGRLLRGELDPDDEPITGEVTLNKIFGGDILTTSFLQRQIWVIILIAVFIVCYISNRYSCQRSLATIAELTRTLQEEKYKALSINSQLTEMTRESHVLEYLRTSKDSVLHIATQPPYIINVPNEEGQPQ